MEHCKFCGCIIVDDIGERTPDFEAARKDRNICVRCLRAFEFSIGS